MLRLFRAPDVPWLPDGVRGRNVVVVDGAIVGDPRAAAEIIAPLRALRPGDRHLRRHPGGVAGPAAPGAGGSRSPRTPAARCCPGCRRTPSRRWWRRPGRAPGSQTAVRRGPPARRRAVPSVAARRRAGPDRRRVPRAHRRRRRAARAAGPPSARTPTGCWRPCSPGEPGRCTCRWSTTRSDERRAVPSAHWQRLSQVRSAADPDGLFVLPHLGCGSRPAESSSAQVGLKVRPQAGGKAGSRARGHGVVHHHHHHRARRNTMTHAQQLTAGAPYDELRAAHHRHRRRRRRRRLRRPGHAVEPRDRGPARRRRRRPDRAGRRGGGAFRRPTTAWSSPRRRPATAPSPRWSVNCWSTPPGSTSASSTRRAGPGSAPASSGCGSSRRPRRTAWRRCPAPSPTSASSGTPPAAVSARWPAPTGWPPTGSARSRSSPATASCDGRRPPSTPTCSSGCAAARARWASSPRSSSTWCTSRRSTAARCGSTASTPPP